MIKITIQNHHQLIVGFSVSGHSLYAVHGADIICAAVSALSQTAIPALTQVLGVAPEWARDEGFLNCRIPDGLDERQTERAQIVLQTLIVGLENIARQYPTYIQLMNEEV
ncbi:MAG: ribosomal-processing cysteine protease Prp [Firmicutes bacterium]|nr:ribosomal-processing cysteine protease Prp [Bacillota bacterium]